jgi:prepilin-type N-terminal cleavage/methylation domain-containing protein
MVGKNKKAQGFSLLESLIVIGVMSILAGITLIKSFGTMESYRANAAMDVVISQLRVARQLAISQRRNVLIQFNLASTPQTISYQVQQGAGVNSGANGPLVKMPLPNQTQFVVESGVPDTPMLFGTCSGTSPICIGGIAGGPSTLYFSPTGQFSDQWGVNIYNGTLFIGIPNQPATARAVTVMGSTGRVRPYTFIGPTGGASSVVWIE